MPLAALPEEPKEKPFGKAIALLGSCYYVSINWGEPISPSFS
jgi:hypothetical protein